MDLTLRPIFRPWLSFDKADDKRESHNAHNINVIGISKIQMLVKMFVAQTGLPNLPDEATTGQYLATIPIHPQIGFDMLISHGFVLSPPDDHLIIKCRTLLTNLLTSSERHTSVCPDQQMLWHFKPRGPCRGDAVPRHMGGKLWTIYTYSKAALLTGCDHHTPIGAIEFPGGLSRVCPPESRRISTGKACQDLNGVDQVSSQLLLDIQVLVPCWSTAQGLTPETTPGT